MADYSAIADKLMQTWPARMAQDTWQAVQAPGNAYASTPENPVTTEQMIQPAMNLAGIMAASPIGGPPGIGILGSGAIRRPYEGVPDSLMGFRKNGPNRVFYEDNFKHEVPVRVDFGGGNIFEDSIKGLNKPHALERARRNWPDAKIEPIE